MVVGGANGTAHLRNPRTLGGMDSQNPGVTALVLVATGSFFSPGRRRSCVSFVAKKVASSFDSSFMYTKYMITFFHTAVLVLVPARPPAPHRPCPSVSRCQTEPKRARAHTHANQRHHHRNPAALNPKPGENAVFSIQPMARHVGGRGRNSSTTRYADHGMTDRRTVFGAVFVPLRLATRTARVCLPALLWQLAT